MTLYELTDDYLKLMDLIDDPYVDPEVFNDTLESIEGGIEDKADGYAKVIQGLKADLEGIKAEIDRLSGRKKTIENNIARMKQNLTSAMVLTGKRKFKTGLFSFSVRPSVSTVIDNADAVPDEFVRIKREPDKTAIKKAIQDGKEITFAHLEEKEGVTWR